LEFIPESDKPIFTFLTRQGIRPGEARALKVKDLDFKHEILIVQRTFSTNVIRERTKSKKVFPRFINPELIPLLIDLCKEKLPEAFVFTNPRTGRPYTEQPVTRRWNKALKKADVD